MRIAFVTTQSDSMGGSHVHVRDVSSALRAEGHEVRVFVGGNGPYLQVLRDRGVEVRSLDHMVRPLAPRTDVRAVSELAAALREYRPDLVSCHSSKAGIVGRLAGRRAKLPTLFTAHGWSFADGIPERTRRIYIAAERYVGRFSPRIVCVAEADRQLGIQERIAPPERIVTVHNGMPDSPERARPGEGVPRIVSVARLDEQKDHPTLLRALGGLTDLPWALDLVGGGTRVEEMRALAAEVGIADRVAFHGVQSNVKPFLEGAAVFALISNWEGFPRSTVEAMRTGLPAVVSDVGGSREALVEGGTGFAVPRGDVDAVRDRLRRILSDPGLRARMGVAARARYEENFTFESMFEKTKRVYQDVLSVRR